MSTNYETDFYAWANEQAALLRSGRLAEADIAHIAEEIESMGKTEKRELASQLTLLLLHLLKWKCQPGRRSRGWEASIRLRRNLLADHLDDNPSLKAIIPTVTKKSYQIAVLEAVAQPGFPGSTFPGSCPWSFDEMMDPDFWPEERNHQTPFGAVERVW